MDLEERKRQLAELKAAREAKQRQMERLAQSTTLTASTTSVSADATTPVFASSSAAGSPVMQSPARPTADVTVPPQQASMSCVSEVGVVDVPPIERVSRHSDTDAVFVYEEERDHPTALREKQRHIETLEAELQRVRDELQTFQQQVALPHQRNDGRHSGGVLLQQRGFTFADKSGTNASHNTVRTPAFIEFVSRGARAVEGICRGTSSAVVPGGEGTVSSAVLSASLAGNSGAALSASVHGVESSSQVAVRLLRRTVLKDSAIGKDRVISSLSFTSTPDMVLVAMSAAEGGAAGTAQGLVLLWNLRRPQQAPLQFVCKDEVKVVTHSPFHEHLIIGGTTNGRIVCWNTLSGEAPVAISFPSLDAHRSAILSLVVRGDSNSNQLVSVCRDGRVCTWQPEKPRSPLSSLAPPSDHNLGALCAASFICTSQSEATDGASRLVAGTVDGLVYSTVSKGTRAVDLKCLAENRRHENAVACAACHPFHTDPRITELILTASADPACFLWFGSTSVVLDAFTDNVYDVAWCPVHPALFAAADGSGRVTLWNITSSLLAPVCSATLQQASGASAAEGGAANFERSFAVSTTPSALKVQWDRNGERILCGTSNGDVCVFDVINAAASAESSSARNLSEWVSKTFAAEGSS
jgi:WD40 repeat protein